MIKETCLGLLTLFMLGGAPLARGADVPSLHEVYQAADAGRVDEALGMMDKVLQAQPNSAKAHFVEAELLVKQGALAKAQVELARAEQLAPGLPFAKPEAVQALRDALKSAAPAPSTAPAEEGGFSWGWLVAAALLVALILAMKKKRAPNPERASMDGEAASPESASGAAGVGSKLATGLAVGAAAAAGAALVHHLTESSDGQESKTGDSSSTFDLGGKDFGVSESSSWSDDGDSSWSDD